MGAVERAHPGAEPVTPLTRRPERPDEQEKRKETSLPKSFFTNLIQRSASSVVDFTKKNVLTWFDNTYPQTQPSLSFPATAPAVPCLPRAVQGFSATGPQVCMGDNSAQSSDSRTWGTVPERLMLGKAVFVFWPFWFDRAKNRIGFIK